MGIPGGKTLNQEKDRQQVSPPPKLRNLLFWQTAAVVSSPASLKVLLSWRGCLGLKEVRFFHPHSFFSYVASFLWNNLVIPNIIPTFAAPKLNLMYNNMSNIESTKGEIVMYQPDETIRLEVRVEDETVWLTQQQISDLFLRDRSVINRHINNVFKEGECDKESNVHFLHIPNSDKPVMYYSLDVIISELVMC